MASTNHTTNYNLSQYVATDKPTYLVDYNNDMLAIDTQMKANATAVATAQNAAETADAKAVTADGKAVTAQSSAAAAQTSADSANTKIGTMANLETADKTSLVNALNEVINEININQHTTFDPSISGQISVTNASLYSNEGMLYCSTNSSGTLAKIYGFVRLNTENTTATPVVSIQTSLRPQTDIIINSVGINVLTDSNDTNNTVSCDLKIYTTGVVEIYGANNSATKRNRLIIHPCILYIKDFGDVITPSNN